MHHLKQPQSGGAAGAGDSRRRRKRRKSDSSSSSESSVDDAVSDDDDSSASSSSGDKGEEQTERQKGGRVGLGREVAHDLVSSRAYVDGVDVTDDPGIVQFDEVRITRLGKVVVYRPGDGVVIKYDLGDDPPGLKDGLAVIDKIFCRQATADPPRPLARGPRPQNTGAAGGATRQLDAPFMFSFYFLWAVNAAKRNDVRDNGAYQKEGLTKSRKPIKGGKRKEWVCRGGGWQPPLKQQVSTNDDLLFDIQLFGTEFKGQKHYHPVSYLRERINLYKESLPAVGELSRSELNRSYVVRFAFLSATNVHKTQPGSRPWRDLINFA
jgi:hypothetical protein